MSKKEKPSKSKLKAVPTPKAKEKNFKFIIGTEGNPDYLVVAESSDVVLGVKPILAIVPQPTGLVEILIGARVRLARNKGEEGTVVQFSAESVKKMTKKEPLSKFYPDIAWEKSDDTRCSVQIGMSVPAKPWEHGYTETALKQLRYHHKLWEWLVKRIPEEDFIIGMDDAIEYLKDQYHTIINELEKSFPKQMKEVNPEAEIQSFDDIFKKMVQPPSKEDKAAQAGLKVIKGKKDDEDKKE